MTTPVLTTGDRKVRISVDKKYVIVELVEDGKTKDRDRLNPDMRSRRMDVLKRIGVDDGTLLNWIDQTKQVASTGNASPQEYLLPKPARDGGDEVIVRGMSETDEQGVRHPLDPAAVLKELLPTVTNDNLIKWKDSKALCCLDVDYHEAGRKPPHESWLRARVTADLAPRPFAWHFSKGGGLHLFYIASDPFTARELAAVAALAFRKIDPTAAVELKTGLRGPAKGLKQPDDKTIYFTPGEVQDTTRLLLGWSERSPADDKDRDDWLAAEGMEIGMRYGHSKCPINPTPGYESTGEPVKPMETGVYCHRCEGEGRSLRVRRPGFAPYTAIIGGESAGDLGVMLRNLCHWGHARYVLTKKYGFHEQFAEEVYRAALKAFHHGTPKATLVPLAFADSTVDLTRVAEGWMNVKDGKPFERDGMRALVADIPAVLSANEDGKVRVSESLLSVYTQPHSLADRGYPPIDTIHGYSLRKRHLADTGDTALVEIYPETLRKAGPQFMPEYVPASRRKLEASWKLIEKIMPSIDRELVTLVMCAIGNAQETVLGMHPKLFVAGAAGSAKTTTPKIAAAILGSHVADFAFKADEHRWGQQMWKTNREGGLVMFNEIIKDTERANRGRSISAAEPFLPLLNVTPEAHANVPYVGSRPYGRLSAFVLTEPSLPTSLRDEMQVARRMWYWRVKGLKNWSDSFRAAGMSGALGLRLVSPAVAQACNDIMSDVIDRFFSKPMSWEEMADAHKCQNIARSDEFEDVTPFLRELFRLVCLAPDITNKALAKKYPRYKQISRASEGTDDGPLAAVYGMFADGRGSEWLQSRKLTEKDWTHVLGTDKDVKLNLTTDGSNVYIRFIVGRLHAPTHVNGEIVDVSSWEAIT